jgi:hypothetical protein
MIVCIVGIAVFEFLVNSQFREKWHPVFWLESLALVSFGFSWITKAEMVFSDDNKKKPEPEKVLQVVHNKY